MKLITKRLTVMSLTPEQMMMYMRNVHDLEKELTLVYHAEPVEGEFRDIVRKRARFCEDDEDNYLWYTFWIFHLDREMIGSARFNGLPDNDGMVELMFGINRDFMNAGYTTEAVNKLVDWAFRQEGVKHISAETDKGNLAAQRVLEKCGFEKYKATENSFRWIISATMLARKKAEEATRNPSMFKRKQA